MKFHITPLDILNSKIKVKIANFLLTHEASMSEREIASILRISHMSVNRALREFAEINLVSYVNVGKAHLWKVNRQSLAYNIIKKLLKGALDAADPLNDLKGTIIKKLPLKSVKKVALYGSISKNTEKSDSDIDLFILVKNNRTRKKIEPNLDKLAHFCFITHGNRLEPYVLTETEFKNKRTLKIVSEINNGIQIFPLKEGAT